MAFMIDLNSHKHALILKNRSKRVSEIKYTDMENGD